jgi:ribosomal protein S18 acetylase RimI-like enzyme
VQGSRGAGAGAESPEESQIVIREARIGDAEALAALAVETYAEAFGHSFSPDDLAAHLEKRLSRERFEQMLREDTFLVAEARGRLIGYVQFGRPGDAADAISDRRRELRRLYVHTDHQNRGIGGRLMDAALAHPSMRDAEQITLDVWEHNHAAQRFYARYGFEVIGTRPFLVESGAETSPDLIMARRRNGPSPSKRQNICAPPENGV